MQSELQTLSKIFTEKLFRIPDYQRGYAWTENQLADYWSDLSQIPEGGNHYTGVLTLETVEFEVAAHWADDVWIIKSKGFEPYHIVDGQQRITTSIILIQCIASLLKDEADTINYTTRQEIEKKYLFDTKDGGRSRSYIFGYEKDNPSYEYLKTQIFEEVSASDRQEETVYTNNLSQAKKFFQEKLENLTRVELEQVFSRVTQRLLFNIFTISREVDVCVAFETMNNRGKPLSYLELLKNRLIYLSTKLDVDQEESANFRRSVNECWKTIYHNLGRNKDKPLDDDFFLRSHHFITFLEPAPEKVESSEDARKHRRLASAIENDEYKKLLNEIFSFNSLNAECKSNPEDGTQFLRQMFDYSISLQEAVKMWFCIFNPQPTNDPSDHNFWLAKINRLNEERLYPLVLSIMLATKDNDERKLAFQEMERYIFIDRLTASYYGAYEMIALETLSAAIRLQRREIPVSELTRTLKHKTDQITNSAWWSKILKENLRNRNFYSWKAILYLLYEYNLELQLSSKTDREKIEWGKFVEKEQDYRSVEHIYPQNARHKYWLDHFPGLTAHQRGLVRNAIGNLLPLSKPKNSSLSNSPYPEKIKGRTPKTGYAFGSYAENEVVVDYPEWTPKAILDRSLRMLDFIEKRWAISLGKDSDKVDILGLGFLGSPLRATNRIYGTTDSTGGKAGSKKK